MNINPNEIGLYTIFIDEEPLSNFKEYEDMVVNSISPETGEEACENKGVCSSCGSFKNLTSNMTKTK